jgi:VanZ family protein
MRPLRFRYWWLSGGILLVGYVLYTTLAPNVGRTSLFNDKLAHFIAFAVLMSWFAGVFRLRLLPVVALLLACLGIGIELLQAQLTYRTAEVADALYDFGGIAVAWALAAAGLGRWAELVEGRVLR